MHPASADAVGVREAWDCLGVLHNSEADGLCRELLACTNGLDVQLDVDDLGNARGPFGLEFFLGDSAAESLLDERSGKRAMSLLEEAALVDKRWRQTAEACLSRRTALPGEHGFEPCVVSVRPFSVKLKVLDGNPLPAKLYLRGDAGFVGEQ